MAPHGLERTSLGNTLDLRGKEVYLAQVPAGFDVSKAAFKSETEVVCDGVSYFVSSSAKLAPCSVLNESHNGRYEPSGTKLAGLLAFTQKVQLPKIEHAKVYTPKPRVPQRRGLHLRHYPTGYAPEQGQGPVPAMQGTRSKRATKEEDDKSKPKRKHKHRDESRKKRKKERKE